MSEVSAVRVCPARANEDCTNRGVGVEIERECVAESYDLALLVGFVRGDLVWVLV